MNPLYGPLTADQRETLTATSDMLALLPVPGCRDLSLRLGCIAHTHRPAPADLAASVALARTVRQTLLLDTCPDRWLDEISDLNPALQTDLIADLIAQRNAQAEQVALALTLLHTLLPASAPAPTR